MDVMLNAMLDMIKNNLWMVLLIIGALIVIAVLSGKSTARPRPGKLPTDYPYVARKTLFSPTEHAFLKSLQQALPEHDIFGQVRLEELITVKNGLDQRAYTSARNQIRNRHVDFIICDRDKSTILCAVELDDASHNREDKQRVDRLKDKALAAAKIPLLRIKPARTYDTEQLRRQLLKAINTR
jgi:hypothetical protein